MLNFNFISIKRAIMHQILGKTAMNENVHCEFSEELLEVDRATETILIDRLTSSFGRNSKSFELTMADDSEGSTFSFLQTMHSLSDVDFIDNTKNVTQILAQNSNRGGIPGGFLLFLDCEYQNHPLYVLIKAEPHDAISVAHHQAQALRDIILSPTQKLFKAFCMIQKTEGIDKDDFTYLLFDDQFTSGTALARYFYSGFLGLTFKDNCALLTKLFFDRMSAMIKTEFGADFDQRSDIEAFLYSLMTDQTPTINPTNIINSIIPMENRDRFLERICVDEFSRSFTKDTSLLVNAISKRRIDICYGLKISGNSDFLASKVSFKTDPQRPGIKIIEIDTNQ